MVHLSFLNHNKDQEVDDIEYILDDVHEKRSQFTDSQRERLHDLCQDFMNKEEMEDEREKEHHDYESFSFLDILKSLCCSYYYIEEIID